MKLSLQHILAICLIPLLFAESSLAATFNTGSISPTYYRLAPTMVIDISKISTNNLISNRYISGSLIDKSENNIDAPYNFSEPPRFTVDLTNIDLFRFNKASQLVRYIRTDSGEQSLSIIDRSGNDFATSLIVHDDFVGIGQYENRRHFIIGKESREGETILRARWGYKF